MHCTGARLSCSVLIQIHPHRSRINNYKSTTPPQGRGSQAQAGRPGPTYKLADPTSSSFSSAPYHPPSSPRLANYLKAPSRRAARAVASFRSRAVARSLHTISPKLQTREAVHFLRASSSATNTITTKPTPSRQERAAHTIRRGWASNPEPP